MTGYKPYGYKEKSRVPAGRDRATDPTPAPGNLETVRAFLNTVDATGVDRLASPRDLADWLARHGLLASGSPLADADLERARDARAGLRALVADHAGVAEDGAGRGAAVTRLDRAAAGARAQVRFDPDGTTRLELASRDFDDALGTLLGFVHVARVAGEWPALKLCADPGCRRAFFDVTKNHGARWCTRRCGDRIRARAYRRSPKYLRRARRPRR